MKPCLPFLTVLVAALLAPVSFPSAQTLPAPATASAQPARSTYTYTLSNGMQLWVRPDRRAPTAVHMVWVRVGSMDEVDGTSGVAHVLEHMMFKGTARLAPGEFSRRVAALGGRENAFTSKDYTGYFQQIPANRLEDVMQLEADRLVNNQWPDDEFARELEVVKEERRMRTEDNPRALLHEVLGATALSASPYRRPIVGWMSDLDAMTAQDARDFYKRWYTPLNAVVVVAGDVDPEQVRAGSQTPGGPAPDRRAADRPQGARRAKLCGPGLQGAAPGLGRAPTRARRCAGPDGAGRCAGGLQRRQAGAQPDPG